jgi:hypothetical protein
MPKAGLFYADGLSYLIKLQARNIYRYTTLARSSVGTWDMKPVLCLPITNPSEETAKQETPLGAFMADTAMRI